MIKMIKMRNNLLQTTGRVLKCESLRFIQEMDSKSVNTIITDPPYDITSFPLSEFERICNGNIIVFCPPENQFFKPDEFLYWIKPLSTKNFSRKCGRFVEFILVKRQGGTFNSIHWSSMTGVFDDKIIEKIIHPFQKPLSLMEKLVRIYSNENDIILDPFVGSGSTCLAARNCNRNFLGIEQNEEYYKLACKRLDDKHNQ